MGAFCMNDLEITPAEAKQRLDRGEGVLLVDVREPWEFEICRIQGAKLIPMGTIPANLQALDTDDEVICYCHHGMRSLDVAGLLRGEGGGGSETLGRGIDRWAAGVFGQISRVLFGGRGVGVLGLALLCCVTELRREP